MSLRALPFRLAPLLILACLASTAPADDPAKSDGQAAAEAKARAFERERLVRRARSAVGDRSGRDPFEVMQRSLADDHAYMMGVEPRDAEEVALLAEFEKTVQERIRLVGWPGDDRGTPAKDGALQEARRLDAWLAGRAHCGVLVRGRNQELAAARGYNWSWPPEPETPKPEVVAEETPVEAAPPGPPPPAGDPAAPSEPPSAPADDESADGAEAEPEPEPQPVRAVPLAPPAPEDLDAWAKTVVEKGEGGTLRRKIVSTAVCGVVDALLKAAAQNPVYRHPDVLSLRRHAIVSKDVFAYNAPYAALRLLQAEEREKIMQEDQPPPSLVDEAMVRGKSKRLGEYKQDLADRQAQREAVVHSLDQMVRDLDDWKTQAALLAQEIEERQRALVPPEGEGAEKPEDGEAPPAPPAPLALRLAEARESLVSLDITLLYLTAVRADERLKLLDRLILATEAEAQSAEQAHTRYATALLKLRGARRLDRLYSDQYRLRLWIGRLEETQPAEGTVFAARLQAYQSVLSLLEVVEDAVVRQRELAPGGAKEDPSEPDAPPKDAGGQATEASGAEKPSNPLPSILRNPEQATWDIKYAELAARALADPKMNAAFGARLIARHYAAADDRIRALLLAQEHSTQEVELQSRYDQVRADAETALVALPADDFAIRTRKLPNLLAVAAEDFEAAMTGIGEQGKRNRVRLNALVEYRQVLLNQGSRSLLIRTDPDLRNEDIQDAFGDTTSAVGKAARWLTLKEENHLGGFLGGSWLRLLGLLVLLVGLVYGVLRLRKRIDAWIERKAEQNPALRAAGASVREERAEAKRMREESDTVASVSDEAILQAVIEPEETAPPSESPGEGEEPVGEEPTTRKTAEQTTGELAEEKAEEVTEEPGGERDEKPREKPADPPSHAAGGAR